MLVHLEDGVLVRGLCGVVGLLEALCLELGGPLLHFVVPEVRLPDLLLRLGGRVQVELRGPAVCPRV